MATARLTRRVGAGLVRRARRYRARFPREREELAAYVARLRGRRLPDPRAVLFAQGRTGSTLLGELLGSHPAIEWADEILGRRVRSPIGWVDGRARQSRKPGFGFHVKVYQLTDIQRTDPGLFLRRLSTSGWTVFYLHRRDVVRRALSYLVAAERGMYHDRSGDAAAVRLRVDADWLLKNCAWHDQQTDLESEALRGLPYVGFSYEEDLLDPSRWQSTADRAFAGLGLGSSSVDSRLRKTMAQPLDELIVNYDEIREALAGTRYETFLSSA